MDAAKIPNWFWATLAVIVVGTIAAVMYCNSTSSLYNQTIKNDLTTANNQNTNTSTSNPTPNQSTTSTTTETPMQSSNIFDTFGMLINM